MSRRGANPFVEAEWATDVSPILLYDDLVELKSYGRGNAVEFRRQEISLGRRTDGYFWNRMRTLSAGLGIPVAVRMTGSKPD